MTENCRPITAIDYTVTQIGKVYADLVELDEHTEMGEYHDEYEKLFNDINRVYDEFVNLRAKVLVDHPELEIELNKENTRVDALKFILNDVLEEQELINQFIKGKHQRYSKEIWMLEDLTRGLRSAYKSVRTTIRWDKGGMND